MKSALILSFLLNLSLLCYLLCPHIFRSSQNNILNDKYYIRRVDHFEKLQNKKGQIVFLGNSLTEGCEWSELLDNPNIINRGISSDNTVGILNRMEWIKEAQPDKIFLMIGLNDLVNGTPINTIQIRIETIIDSIISQSQTTKIFIQSILPIDSTKFNKTSNFKIQKLNMLIREFDNKSNTTYVNLYPSFLNEKGNLNEIYTNDGVHLNGDGYLLWAKLIENFMK